MYELRYIGRMSCARAKSKLHHILLGYLLIMLFPGMIPHGQLALTLPGSTDVRARCLGTRCHGPNTALAVTTWAVYIDYSSE
jgi:hypothetical protein